MHAIYYLITLAATGIVGVLYAENILELKDIGTSILALFGTFLGATLAFRLTENKEQQKIKSLQREALNRVLFVLIRQHNAIIQLKRDFDKYPKDFEAAFNMPALKPPAYGDLVHNISDLEFLLESSNPNILFKLTVEQERFHQAIDSLRIRNEFYVNEVQRAIATAAMNGKSVSIEEAAKLLGERIFGGAMNGAKFAREHIIASNESIPEIMTEFRALAKETFPTHKFLSYEIPQEK
ncbi:MAG: hypothetical protein Q8K12_14220 [Thiobacillus sp.]|nr:hypothetical protein [Thiobacillus sp.]